MYFGWADILYCNTEAIADLILASLFALSSFIKTFSPI